VAVRPFIKILGAAPAPKDAELIQIAIFLSA
jgi:hypothetical protein